MKKLPHVADTMSIDEEEKIEKFARRINDELKRRKKLLSEFSVASLDMYERASGKEEPIILILLDGFEGMKDAKFNEILEKVITQVAREGAGIGVHLLLSAGRQNSLKAILSSNIKTQIVLKMIDDSEPRAIVGRTTLTIDDLPGRGLIKLEEPELFQAALPADGEDTLQIIEAIQEEVNDMDEHWTGARPEPIPMVPDVLYFDDFKQRKTLIQSMENNTKILPLGLDKETVETVYLDYTRFSSYFVTGDRTEKINLFKHYLSKIISLQSEDIDYLVVDDSERQFNFYQDTFTDYTDSFEDGIKQIENVVQLALDRKQAIENMRNAGEEITEILSKIRPVVLILSDIAEYVDNKLDKEVENTFIDLLEEGVKYGIHILGIVNFNKLSGYDTLSKSIKAQKNFMSLSRLGELKNFTINGSFYNEPMLDATEAYYCIDSEFMKIKICTGVE